MFRSVLVANRGEIARRIFRTARRLGIETVAVCSDADLEAAHVRDADRAVRIGPAPAAESYLSIPDLVAAALESGAEAVHPGYGFLSETAAFAEAVQAAGLIWIGPSPAAIRAMGLKDSARERMIAAGVPVTPGWQGDDGAETTLLAAARELGWPVLIKAAAGGGNRSLSGVFLGAEIMTDRVHDMIQGLIDDAARGELEVVIDRTFPLSEAAAAHAYIESRAAVGRVVLVP